MSYSRRGEPPNRREQTPAERTNEQKPEWLAWNPSGPYDSGPGVGGERRMGWLLNPALPRLPEEFASAAKYREEFRPFAPVVPIEAA